MKNFMIREFKDDDAKRISEIVRRNFLEVNIRDYSESEMKSLSDEYNPEKILEINSYADMYVACLNNKIVGCGAISSFWSKEDESILLTIFVLPELHGKGIGKKIIERLESHEYFLRAKRIEIPSSITACEFYRKFGYDYKDGIKQLDNEGHYRLEKFRKGVTNEESK
ncbi:MAG: GNAT family N-acetyltransferase [Fusobacteriota bacterium]